MEKISKNEEISSNEFTNLITTLTNNVENIELCKKIEKQ